jgi:hypothetical protein
LEFTPRAGEAQRVLSCSEGMFDGFGLALIHPRTR